jgi:hypothetical protein
MSVAATSQLTYSPAAATAVVKRMRIDSSFISVKLLMNVVTLQVIFDFRLFTIAFMECVQVQDGCEYRFEPSHLNPIFVEELAYSCESEEKKESWYDCMK